jgi:hypothetical protein
MDGMTCVIQDLPSTLATPSIRSLSPFPFPLTTMQSIKSTRAIPAAQRPVPVRQVRVTVRALPFSLLADIAEATGQVDAPIGVVIGG